MKKLLSMLLLVSLCCGMLMGCTTRKNEPVVLNDEPVADEPVAQDEEDGGMQDDSPSVSDNDVLPHDNSIRLSDTKQTIESKEVLTENEYGIEGLWNSESTWHVEDSDFEISYSFADDGSIQYVTYILVDSSLSDIELGFIEVTANYELQKLYGDGEGSWYVNSGEKVFEVTLEVDEDNSSILVKIMPA